MTSSTAPGLVENEEKGSQPQRPDINDGLAYWNSIAKQDSITNNGVLDGQLYLFFSPHSCPLIVNVQPLLTRSLFYQALGMV
jgi:hypothetical protein